MYTPAQLIPLSKTLLEVENNMHSGVSHVKEAPCFFKNFSLDSRNDSTRPLAVTTELSDIHFEELELVSVESRIQITYSAKTN